MSAEFINVTAFANTEEGAPVLTVLIRSSDIRGAMSLPDRDGAEIIFYGGIKSLVVAQRVGDIERMLHGPK